MPESVKVASLSRSRLVFVVLLLVLIFLHISLTVKDASLATVTRSDTTLATKCPTQNVDIFLVTYSRDFPLTSFVIRSIYHFMPCHGNIHVVVDEGDRLALNAWIDTSRPDIYVHTLEVPPAISFLTGYISQAVMMMFADTFAHKINSSADFMMFLDTDAPLGLPITCNSLFDSNGKAFIAGWDIQVQGQFLKCVEDMVGPGSTRSSYMSYFPFLMPLSTFPRMRNHIAKQLNASSFLDAFVRWAQLPDVNVNHFSQFAVMGAYMEAHERNLVRPIFCPKFGEHGESECATWVPPGVHLGWRPCAYVDGCVSGRLEEFRAAAPTEFSRYSEKFAASTVETIEDLFVDGTCFGHYVKTGSVLDGCTEHQSRNVNPELLPYPKDPPSFARLQEFFMEDKEILGFCPSAELKKKRENPGMSS